MAEKIKGLTIEIAGDVTPLNKALGEVNNKSKDLQSELKKVERLLKFDPQNTELLTQKQRLLGESIENTEEKLKTLKTAADQAKEKLDIGEITQSQYRTLQREVIATEQELKKLSESAKVSQKTMGDFGNKLKDVGGKATEAGKALTKGLTGPIVAMGVASQVAWKKVDGALDTIITKTGATGEAAEELKQAFNNVSGSLPVDLQKSGDAIGEVNTQFALMGEELEKASEQVIKFSEINGQDVSETAIDARQAIEAYGLETKNLNGVLDAVTKTAQNTGQSTQLLFNKVTTGAPQIKALGLNFAQATELVGKFEQKGIDSSKALGYMNKAQVEFAKEGKTLEQGLVDITEKIINSTSETEALTAASEVFGTKGASFMVDAIQRGALSFEDLENASKNAAGSVTTTFESTLDPIDQYTTAMNNAKLAGAELGGAIQETIAPFLSKLADILRSLAQWFSGLDDSTKKTIVVLGMLLAAIGPTLIIGGQIITAIGAVITILPLLGAAFTVLTGPIGAVIAIGAILVAAFVELWQTNEGFRDAMKKIWEVIKTVVKNAIDFIMNPIDFLIDKIQKAIEWIKKLKFWEKESGTDPSTTKNGSASGGTKMAAMATGGTITRGTSLVGENGPELLTMGIGIAKVTPLGSGGTGNLAKEIASQIQTTGKGDTFNFYSPKALTPTESARQMKSAKRELSMGF